MLKFILKEMEWVGMDWINLVVERDNLWAVVYMLMYL